jgi:hypothetical protein
MNMKSTIAVMVIAFLCGAGAHNLYTGAASNKLVKLEKTRSGMFIIEAGKIYEVLELPTSKSSFQDEYKLEK